MRALASLGLVLMLALTGCTPKAPKGIDAKALDSAIGDAIGDPTACLILTRKGSGEAVYQYGSNINCSAQIPICTSPGTTSVKELAKAAATTGQSKTSSCPLPAGDGGVGYVMGPLPATKPQYQDLAYAASINGKRYLPGIELQTRLEPAFTKAGF
jgi:hypothetical protein